MNSSIKSLHITVILSLLTYKLFTLHLFKSAAELFNLELFNPLLTQSVGELKQTHSAIEPLLDRWKQQTYKHMAADTCS